jgi:hypothetical protein
MRCVPNRILHVWVLKTQKRNKFLFRYCRPRRCRRIWESLYGVLGRWSFYLFNRLTVCLRDVVRLSLRKKRDQTDEAKWGFFFSSFLLSWATAATDSQKKKFPPPPLVFFQQPKCVHTFLNLLKQFGRETRQPEALYYIHGNNNRV